MFGIIRENNFNILSSCIYNHEELFIIRRNVSCSVLKTCEYGQLCLIYITEIHVELRPCHTVQFFLQLATQFCC